MKRTARIRKNEEGRKEKGKSGLQADLAQLEQMAFGRLKHCGPLVKRFHEMRAEIEGAGRAELVWRIYDWLLVPFSLWPEDFESLAAHVLRNIEANVLGLSTGDSKVE